MKKIIKQISLEQFRSRMPSVIRATNSDGKCYEFSEDSFYSEPYTNYGMFPCDVVYGGERLTFSELTERFHFIEKYYDILNSGVCREEPYSSMTEYWEYEQGNAKYTQEECLDMDVTFEMYSGNAFYSYAVQNYFPRFEIPLEFREFWKCKYLYIPDVLKWIKWFNDNQDSQDQCVKRQYCLLGGNDNMLDKLQTWFKSLNININYPNNDEYCAYVYVPIQLSNSIENGGDMSLFAPEWEEGYNYSVGSASTVVTYNGETYAYSNANAKGYLYDNEFKEMYFDDSSWTPTRSYFSGHAEFTPYVNALKTNNDVNIETYAYHKNGTFIYNPDAELMCEGYLINDNNGFGYVKIDDEILPIFKSNYIEFNEEIYVVNYEQLDVNPWVTVKGKIYRGVYTDSGYIFNIMSNNNIPISESTDLYQYNNKIYKVKSDTKIDGYAEIDGIKFAIKDNELIDSKKFGDYLNTTTIDETSKGYKIEEGILKIYEPYAVYDATIVCGETESKLSSLEYLGGYLYDNIGNKMPGMLKESGETLNSNTVLVPCFKVGQTAHLTKLDEKLYWGDYLAEVNSGQTDYTFVYHIGCEIILNDEKQYVLGGYSGVTYTEVVPYEVKTCQYYLDNKEYIHLKYNELQFDKIVYQNNDYGDETLSVNKARFQYTTSLEVDNEFMLSPVIKEEYKMGINGLENIEADIYINRGTARAYDYHLKLMETKTFDALENYGNSWFKII